MAEIIEAYLRPFLRDDCVEDSEVGAWYLSPTQHVIEYSVVNPILLFVLYKLWNSFKNVKLDETPRQHKACMSLLIPALIVSYIIVWCHKIYENTLIFMVQPCHVIHTMLLFACLRPVGDRLGNIVFNVYLSWIFSAFAALGADRSCYTEWLELENYYLQHGLLILAPVYLIISGRFTVIRDWNFHWFGYTTELLWHFVVLGPLSILSGANLNHMACPVGPLWSFGPWYRVAMLFFTMLLAALSKVLWVDGVALGLKRLIRGRGAGETGQKQE